ncbi:hypothetical protein GF415_00230 [Candidatus Micrarchaeota archaeon]|nr:hypothetical protein [Candidatus Micrarchaeota archaeon]
MYLFQCPTIFPLVCRIISKHQQAPVFHEARGRAAAKLPPVHMDIYELLESEFFYCHFNFTYIGISASPQISAIIPTKIFLKPHPTPPLKTHSPHLKSMQVLKLGGSVLTKKRGYLEPDNSGILSLAKMLSRTWKDGIKDIILVHGAGSFGHPLVVKYSLNDGVKTEAQKLGAAKTHSACVRLSTLLVDALCKEGVPAVSVPPAFLGKMKNRKLAAFNSKPVDDLLGLGYLPVLHGDMLPDSELGCAVCSGDQLVSWLGKNAERIILGTNVDGVCVDGKHIPEISQGNFEEVSAHFSKMEYADVTGGMKGKIKELIGLGVPSYIVNALHPERVESLLRGRSAPSTLVK